MLIANLSHVFLFLFVLCMEECMEETESDYNFKIREEKLLKEFSPNFEVMIKLYNFKWFCKQLKLCKSVAIK